MMNSGTILAIEEPSNQEIDTKQNSKNNTKQHGPTSLWNEMKNQQDIKEHKVKE